MVSASYAGKPVMYAEHLSAGRKVALQPYRAQTHALGAAVQHLAVYVRALAACSLFGVRYSHAAAHG